MKRIDLNCDMGESFGAYTMGMNKKVMANIACGFHAGNPMVMGGTVSLALEKKRGHRCPPRLPGPAGIRAPAGKKGETMRQTLEAGSIQVRPMGRTWPMTAKFLTSRSAA